MKQRRKLKIDGFKAATLIYGPPKTKTKAVQQRLEFEEKTDQPIEGKEE